MPEPEEIASRFEANLGRVRTLADLYESLASDKSGRKPVPTADLLRAAVVFLHATLEDLLRSLLEWKLPLAPAEMLKGIPLAGSTSPNQEKFTLSELARFRDRSVQEIIHRSVAEFLERSSYNNVKDVVDAIKGAGVDLVLDRGSKEDIAILMNRRHLIAHRMDRNHSRGPGHQMARSISSASVKQWIGTVESVGRSILGLV